VNDAELSNAIGMANQLQDLYNFILLADLIPLPKDRGYRCRNGGYDLDKAARQVLRTTKLPSYRHLRMCQIGLIVPAKRCGYFILQAIMPSAHHRVGYCGTGRCAAENSPVSSRLCCLQGHHRLHLHYDTMRTEVLQLGGTRLARRTTNTCANSTFAGSF
jgi:hypothetical protein